MNLKEKVLNTFIQLQEESIRNLKSAVDEAQQMANEYGQPKDRYDSFRTQLLTKRDMYAKQLQKAMDDLLILKKIEAKEEKTKVEFGALVITDQQNILVATGIGKIEISSETYLSISPTVPIYQVLKDKKAKEEVIFNNKTIKIIMIF